MAVVRFPLAIATCLLAATRADSEAVNRTSATSTTTTLISTSISISSTSRTFATTMFTLPFSNCSWPVLPRTLWAWDPACRDGDLGCNADGKHMECRFCGEAPYGACPTCTFPVKPSTPHVWDSQCRPDSYTKGCFADGIHFECRYCGVEWGFDPCPTTTTTSTRGTTTNATESTTEPGSGSLHYDAMGSAPPSAWDTADSSTLRGSGGAGSGGAGNTWGMWNSSGRRPWPAHWVQLASLLCWAAVAADLAVAA